MSNLNGSTTMYEDLKSGALKLVGLWSGFKVSVYLGSVGIYSWSDAAGMATTFLSLILGFHTLWKWWKEAKEKGKFK